MQVVNTVLRIAALGVLVTTLAACSSDDDDSGSALEEPSGSGSTDNAQGAIGDDAAPAINWQPCSDNAALDCASLAAPLIHGSTDARTISIDLRRLPSTGASPRLVMLNPGGPGGSGTEAVTDIEAFGAIPDSVRKRYDIVGFDPRGIGSSDRVDCSEFETDANDVDYVADATELQALYVETAAYSAACSDKYGDKLAWLGSNQVVQDMDLIREVHGADQLDFVGFSYGTRLAALYLERFPERSGRIVLDGPVLPDSSLAALIDGQATGFQANLERLFVACGTTVPDCDPATIESSLQSRIATLIASENEAVVDVFGTLLIEAVLDPAFGEVAAAPLVQFVLSGDPEPLTEFLALVEGLGLIDADDADADEGLESRTVQRAVICADDATRPTPDDLLSTFERLNTLSKTFGRVLTGTIATSCVGWPESTDPLPPIATTAAPASLVIGGSSDAQTPLEWASLMTEAIGGQLLVSNHFGHTVIFSDESECVDAVVLGFLLDGTLPAMETCESDAGLVLVE